MPSDATAPVAGRLHDRALRALDARITSFHAAVAAADHEVREQIVSRSGESRTEAERAATELGPFATGRIDPERFAKLLGISDTQLSAEAFDVLDRADHVLTRFSEDTTGHYVRVEEGGDLRDSVKAAFAHFGQAYGAARAVELARAEVFDADRHGQLLGPLPFRLWNRAERHLAPPLVVDVRGEDCLPAGLGEFLDGNVVIVLVASGPTTPAPLSRLITPGTFVMQTANPEDVERVAHVDHPAVVLLFDEDRPEQAHFVHDPDAGATPWGRLSVTRLPSDAVVGRGRRAPVWLEELAHLAALAEEPGATNGAAPDLAAAVSAGAAGAADAAVSAGPAGGAGATAGPAVQPADRLAAWLLAQTDLGDR